MCNQLTPFIWSYDMTFALSTQLTPFKIIWLKFVIVYQMDSSQQNIAWVNCIVYTIDSFQDHLI